MKRIVYGFSSAADDTADWFGACATREEAIAEAPAFLELTPGDAFYVCQAEYPDSGALVPDLRLIVDHMWEALNEIARVPGQELVVDDGAGAALDAALETWARQYVTVAKWVLVDEVERHIFQPAPAAPPEQKTEEVTPHANGAAAAEVKDVP